MKKLPALLLAFGLLISTQANAVVVDFEDATFPSVSTVISRGMEFSTAANNGVFPGFGGADNGTNMYSWCSSHPTGCNGYVEIVGANLTGNTPFSLFSIDAGNTYDITDPYGLGYSPGMTLEIRGNLVGGGSVSQSLLIVENVMTTFTLVGFNNLLSFNLFVPTVGGVYPNANIDNLVYEAVAPVPLPAAAWLFGAGFACMIGFRKRMMAA